MTEEDLYRESFREPTREQAVAAADRLHAENKTLRAKLEQVQEDLDDTVRLAESAMGKMPRCQHDGCKETVTWYQVGYHEDDLRCDAHKDDLDSFPDGPWPYKPERRALTAHIARLRGQASDH
jgi:hypothetical protein